MAAKVSWKDLILVVVGAVVVGMSVGLGVGFLARSQGWPTDFVGPLTGGLVGALVLVFYTRRAKRAGGSI